MVRQIDVAAAEAREPALEPAINLYRHQWIRPLMPVDISMRESATNVVPDSAALSALALVSAQLHQIASEGPIPDGPDLERLKSQLRDVIDGVSRADDIPNDVQHDLIEHLQEVERALQHLDVGGPAAVHRATEALTGRVVLTRDQSLWQNPRIRKLVAVAAGLWIAFTSGPEIQSSIEAWGDILAELESPKVTQSGDGQARDAAVAPPSGSPRRTHPPAVKSRDD